jgi:NAD(P)-dependent dehydrogenase (short-subunit alcohol dehydrogenase family)
VTPEARRIALVTGASRGIGRAAALALSEAGNHVVAVARTTGALEELDDEIQKRGGTATLVPLDLNHGDAIDQLGGAIFDRFGRLDALFANAAIAGPVTPVAHIEPRAWDAAFATNLTANYRLIRSFDALLRISPAGRALFVTSSAARESRPYFGLYAATKAGLETLVAAYAAEAAVSNVKVNLIAPGPLRTRLRAEAHPGEDPATVAPPETIAQEVVRMLSPDYTQTGMLFDFPSARTVAVRSAGSAPQSVP